MKTCGKCKVTKPLDEFYVRADGTGLGRYSLLGVWEKHKEFFTLAESYLSLRRPQALVVDTSKKSDLRLMEPEAEDA